MATRPLRYVSVCTGAGGLDLALELACEYLGLGRPEPLLYMEREISAARILASRMADGCIRPARIWSDLTTFDARKLRGLVDLIIGGLPCQPFSVAGQQRGEDDERFIWPDFIRILEACRPTLVFLENVPPFVSGGHFRNVGEELSRVGYSIEDPLFLAAEDVGLPHKRERVFVLAYCDDRGCGAGWWSPEWIQRTERHGASMANSRSADGRSKGCQWADRERAYVTHRRSGALMDACAVDHSAIARHCNWRSDQGAQVRNEARRGESCGRRDDVAVARCERDQRRGISGIVSWAPGQTQAVGEERQRSRHATDGCECAMDDAECSERWPLSLGRSCGGEGIDGSGQAPGGAGVTDQNVDDSARDSKSGRGILPPGPNGDWSSINYESWPATSHFGLFVYRLRRVGLLPMELEGSPQAVGAYLRAACRTPEVKSAVRRILDGVAAEMDRRAPRLRAGGNGVVSLQGAIGFIELVGRIRKAV